MEPQSHDGPGLPIRPSYPPQQYYAQNPHQYPQYGPPQQWGPPQPKKKSKLGWILGGIALAVVILLFAGCSALVSNINGGGGSHANKMAAMKAAVDNVPEAGWTETSRFERKVDPGCLSIDTHCLRLEVAWAIDHGVTVDEVASRLGKNIDDFKAGGSGGGTCMVHRDASSMTEVCVGDRSDGRHGASVTMTRS